MHTSKVGCIPRNRVDGQVYKKIVQDGNGITKKTPTPPRKTRNVDVVAVF